MKAEYLGIVVLVIAISFTRVGQAVTSVDPAQHCPVPEIKANIPSKDYEAPAGTADLNSVIATVESAIQCYQQNRGAGPDALPPLQQAEFDFKSTTGKIGGLTVSFFIFKIGASREKDTTNEITFTYTLPKASSGSGLALKFAKPPQLLAEAIVADIQSAAAAVKTRAQLDKLSFSKLKIVLQFGVVFDGSVAINAPVKLVTIGGNGEYKRNETQSVTLTFATGSQP